ncbi:hypothetical protein ACFPPA_01005 [Rhodanobacter ginsengisoli]|uniref:Uncharacterized protein n=1 Tax=Rhodanobacter ginsengisoli TaxID=418646 RepID=A0ABW0QHB2_9GAMM
MTPSIRTTALHGAALAGLLLLSACGKSEPASPNDTPAPASTAPVAMLPAPAATTATTPVAGSGTTGVATAASVAVSEAAAVSVPLTVARLTVGSDVNAEHQVTHAANSFASNDKTIYASVATEGSSGGATLNAKWSYLEGSGQLVSNISQSIATDGPAITTFEVQNPDLWPEGRYKVEISLDGKPVASRDFRIGKH